LAIRFAMMARAQSEFGQDRLEELTMSTRAVIRVGSAACFVQLFSFVMIIV